MVFINNVFSFYLIPLKQFGPEEYAIKLGKYT